MSEEAELHPLLKVPWEAKAVWLAMLATAAAMPFGRRGGWIGWLALSTLVAAVVVIWGVLIRGEANHAIQWWRDRSALRGGDGKSDDRGD